MAKRIFIAATQQNDGKTTVCLGLIGALRKRFKKIGFIKPIGQRYLIEQGYKVDEDSVLIEKVCKIKCNLKDMSPVAIEKGFTERYIRGGKRERIAEQIRKSFDRVSKGSDLVVIEGTGHAGVGSVFDWSNASVAKLLDSKVVLVTSGGIGRPIDEIVLNQALFEKEGVELIGVIINKVLPVKYKKINNLIRLGLKKKHLEVFGVLPYNPVLSAPTVQQIYEELDAQLVCGQENLQNVIENILVGAMETHEALKYIADRSLVITGGDREDIILAAMSTQLYRTSQRRKIAGFVLTGGIRPHDSIIEMVRNLKIPLLLVKDDTYTAAKKIHDRTIKIRPKDSEKIELVTRMIEEYVDLDKLLAAI